MSFGIGWLLVGVLFLFATGFVIRARFRARSDFSQQRRPKWSSWVSALMHWAKPKLPTMRLLAIGFVLGSLAVFLAREIWPWFHWSPFPIIPSMRG